MIDEADVKYILERVTDICVTRKECDDKTDEINKKLANDSTELALIKSDVSTIKWLAKTILAVIVTGIVGALLSLIIK